MPINFKNFAKFHRANILNMKFCNFLQISFLFIFLLFFFGLRFLEIILIFGMNTARFLEKEFLISKLINPEIIPNFLNEGNRFL